jgi:hypothetical protein
VQKWLRYREACAIEGEEAGDAAHRYFTAATAMNMPQCRGIQRATAGGQCWRS